MSAMNTHPICTPADFAKLLGAEVAAVEQFIQVLQAEQQALTGAQTEKLLELARLKSEKAVQISQLGNRRSQYLSSQGFSSDRSGMEEWLSRHDPSGTGQTGRAWKRLLDLAKEAQELNRANGIMIDAKLRHNQQALAILQSAARQVVDVYGPDGQTKTSGIGRQLGKV